MAKAKPNQKFHVDKLNTALDALDKLETKPKEELSLRESIYFMRSKLNAALRKGYSYEDLSEILAEQDILVSAPTLKLYLTEGGKGKSRSKKSKAANDSKSDSASSINVNDSKEGLGSGNSTAEINRIKKKELKETNQTTTVVTNKSKAKKDINTRNTKVKPRVLSGLDDDLSSEFNQY